VDKKEQVKLITFEGCEVQLVRCGLCGNTITPIKVDPPKPVSEWDRENGYVRDHSYNCCGRRWLINQSLNKSVDCGEQFERK
jgi:hypothetical protein